MSPEKEYDRSEGDLDFEERELGTDGVMPPGDRDLDSQSRWEEDESYIMQAQRYLEGLVRDGSYRVYSLEKVRGMAAEDYEIKMGDIWVLEEEEPSEKKVTNPSINEASVTSRVLEEPYSGRLYSWILYQENRDVTSKRHILSLDRLSENPVMEVHEMSEGGYLAREDESVKASCRMSSLLFSRRPNLPLTEYSRFILAGEDELFDDIYDHLASEE